MFDLDVLDIVRFAASLPEQYSWERLAAWAVGAALAARLCWPAARGCLKVGWSGLTYPFREPPPGEVAAEILRLLRGGSAAWNPNPRVVTAGEVRLGFVASEADGRHRLTGLTHVWAGGQPAWDYLSATDRLHVLRECQGIVDAQEEAADQARRAAILKSLKGRKAEPVPLTACEPHPPGRPVVREPHPPGRPAAQQCEPVACYHTH